MPAQPPRRFGVLDGMILVAALAVASLSIRPAERLVSIILDSEKFAPRAIWYGIYPILVAQVLEPWAAALTVAFLVIRLRRPRPRFRRLMRQPGMAAGVAAASAITANLVVIAVVWPLAGAPAWEDVDLQGGLDLQWGLGVLGSAGVTVAAVWLFMALARVGRPEAGWVDRLGRVLGGVWVAAFLTLTWEAYWSGAILAQAVIAPRPVPLPAPVTPPPAPPAVPAPADPPPPPPPPDEAPPRGPG